MQETHISKKPAVIMADTGESITASELSRRAEMIASLICSKVPQQGVIAILLRNRLEYFAICLGARKAGVYYTPVSTHSKSEEIEYLITNSGAQLIFSETDILDTPNLEVQTGVEVINVDSTEYEALLRSTARHLDASAQRSHIGSDFCYSSGTTGRPKGIKHPLRRAGREKLDPIGNWTRFLNFNSESVYLSPAPLYHAAPLRFSLRCIDHGGTVIVMSKFDAERSLKYIEKYGVTHSQWVPTMFIRLLNLPRETRQRYDLTSHTIAMHAAAPCPLHVKRQMMEWWGSIIWEYYTGSEKAGATVISPHEWSAKPGSVGKAVQGTLHILDEAWNECPPRVEGMVYFEGGPPFEYHNDPDKTREAFSPQGWSTFGDIGYLDEDGYLFLTDRKANMIISGGVNIYPQESENVIQQHPAVKDVAVIGVPHDDFGEEVVAIVELLEPDRHSHQLESEIIDHCAKKLSKIKIPKRIFFSNKLPRTDTGKLMKRIIRDQYKTFITQ